MADILLNTNAVINGTPVTTVTGDVVQTINGLTLTDGSQIQDTDKFLMIRGSAPYHIFGSKFVKNVITAQGDLIVGNNALSGERLPIGSVNQVLTSNGTTALWKNDLFTEKTPSISYITNVNDFPTPTDIGDGNGIAHHLEDNKNYILSCNAPLLLSYPLIFNTNGGALLGLTRFPMVWLGSGAMIRAKGLYTASITIEDVVFSGTSSTQKICDELSMACLSFVFRNQTIADITIGSVNPVFFCQISNIAIITQTIPLNSGLVINGASLAGGCQVDVSKIAHITPLGFVNINESYISLKGTFSTVNLTTIDIKPNNNQSGYNIEPTTVYQSISFNSGGVNIVPSSTGKLFADTSLTPEDRDIDLQNVGGVDNSTYFAVCGFENNATTTTIATINTPTPINIGANFVISNVDNQRLFFQDTVTFNNVTDIITTPFTHAMPNNTRVLFVAGIGGVLPTGIVSNKIYYVINTAATTFQISETINGTPVNFTTNGSGTIYLRHNKGNSKNIGIVNTDSKRAILLVSGFASLQGVVAGNTNMRLVIMKMDTNFNIAPLPSLARGSTANIDNVTINTSTFEHTVILNPNEGIFIYIENTQNADDVICTNLLAAFTKV